MQLLQTGRANAAESEIFTESNTQGTSTFQPQGRVSCPNVEQARRQNCILIPSFTAVQLKRINQ